MIHLVFQSAVQKDASIRFRAIAVDVPESENLMNYLGHRSVLSANVFPTKKRAHEIAEFWNECYRNNNTLLEEV